MVESVSPVGAVELALSAVNAAYGSPDVVDGLASRARAVGGADPEVESILHRAFAIAAWARGETGEAIAHGREAIAIAEAAGVPARAAEARGSLSVHLVIAGDGDGALREIDRALPVLSGSSAARLRMQRALVLDEIGRREESLQDYGLALDLLRDAGDPHIEADLRNNRSIVLTRLRRWQDAEDDLRRAEELYLSTGQPGNSRPSTTTVPVPRPCAATCRPRSSSSTRRHAGSARRAARSGSGRSRRPRCCCRSGWPTRRARLPPTRPPSTAGPATTPILRRRSSYWPRQRWSRATRTRPTTRRTPRSVRTRSCGGPAGSHSPAT